MKEGISDRKMDLGNAEEMEKKDAIKQRYKERDMDVIVIIILYIQVAN